MAIVQKNRFTSSALSCGIVISLVASAVSANPEIERISQKQQEESKKIAIIAGIVAGGAVLGLSTVYGLTKYIRDSRKQKRIEEIQRNSINYVAPGAPLFSSPSGEDDSDKDIPFL